MENNNIENAARRFAPKAAFKAHAKYHAPSKEHRGGVRLSYWDYNGGFLKEVWLKRAKKIDTQEFILHDPSTSAFLVRSAHRAKIIVAATAADARAAFKQAHPNTLIQHIERVSGEAQA